MPRLGLPAFYILYQTPDLIYLLLLKGVSVVKLGSLTWREFRRSGNLIGRVRDESPIRKKEERAVRPQFSPVWRSDS